MSQMKPNWMLLPIISLSLMAVVSAVSGLNVALPAIAVDTGATQTQLTWIVDAYTVVFAGLLFLAGAIGDMYGRKLLLILGLVIFGGASGVGMYVSDPESLILVRVVMGIGAAAVMPSTLSVITTSFQTSERAKAVGIWVGVAGGGAIIGLFGSAMLLEYYRWNAFFALNVTLAVLGCIGTTFVVTESTEHQGATLDWIGGLLVSIGVAALVFGIINGPEAGWYTETTYAAFATAIGSLLAFVLWELFQSNPLLDPRLFGNRAFSAGALSILVQFFGQFGFIFVSIQYLQFVVGYSAWEAAVHLLPLPVFLLPTARLAGQYAKNTPQKYIGSIGLVLFGVGMWLVSLQTATFNLPLWIVALAVYGIGMGCAATPATTAIMSSLPDSKQGVASAVNDTAREFGSALGIAILGAVLTNTYATGMADVATKLPAQLAEKITRTIAFTKMDPPPMLAPMWDRLVSTANDSFALGMTNALHIGAFVAFGAAVFVFIVAPAPTKH
ncbi:MAG: hypothetical protein RLY87_876 [Chloroflexota bacterium]|jgi:EmrB/QacA subfamily drug resistance transporter